MSYYLLRERGKGNRLYRFTRVLEIKLGLDQGLGFSCARVQAQAFFDLPCFSWAWVFPGLQAQDPTQLNKLNPEPRNRPRLFKNLDLYWVHTFRIIFYFQLFLTIIDRLIPRNSKNANVSNLFSIILINVSLLFSIVELIVWFIF